MKDSRYGTDTRRRRPAPRRLSPRRLSPRRPPPRSRGFSPSRPRKYSPHNRQRTGEYEARRSPRIEKKDHFDRDREFNMRPPGFSEYDRDRDGDRHGVGSRRSRSPRRIDNRDRDNFDKEFGKRPLRFPDYDDGGKDKDGVGVGVGVGRSRRPYDEGSYRGDSNSTKFLGDRVLDGSRKTDHLNVKDYSNTRDYYGTGDANITRGDGERDYYLHSRYSGSDRAGLLPVSQYLDSTNNPVISEHERGGRVPSLSYSLARGDVGDIPPSNLSGGDGRDDMSSLASRYLNTDTDKQGYLHFRDELRLEKRDGVAFHDQEDRYFEKKNDGFRLEDGLLGVERPVGREIYKYKEKDEILSSRGYLKGDSDYIVSSSSQPKDYVSSYSAIGDIHMPVSGSGSGLPSEPIGFDGYGEKKYNLSPRGPGLQLNDTRNRSRLYLEENRGDQLQAEFGRSRIEYTTTRLGDVEEKYRDQHIPRIDGINPTDDEPYRQKHSRDDGLWHQYPYSRGRSIPDKFDARKQDLDMLGTGSSRLSYETEGYRGYGSFKPEERHAQADTGSWSRGERSDILHSREYNPSFGGGYNSPRERLAVEDLSERRPRHKHVRDEIPYERGVGIRISTDENGARKIYNQVDVGDKFDRHRLSKKPKFGKSNYYEKTWRGSSERDNYQPSSSKFNPSRLVYPPNSDPRDIKKRLGPVPKKLHVSQRLVKKYKQPSIKRRLAPAPTSRNKRSNLPWMKNASSNRKSRVQDADGSHRDQDGNHSGDHTPLAKPEPPENSEDFKQLVQSAFFKFVKEISETPIKRKKYLEVEQGKAGGRLKCIVCRSKSDEFVETESLAMHAFTSTKAGLRSQHLGLHKAICVQMGWKITENNPTNEWHREAMSNAETASLKDDLIIWPPVVIVHNSTIDNKNAGERVIISAEKMDIKLKDMGYGSILKISYGRPANHSWMVVKFNGTLTGLREAERFHKSYSESNHGRAELEQLLESKKPSSSQVMPKPERDEDFLYGYLAICEDLDRVDFDTKKRCVFRSKNEILSMVDAPLDNTIE